MSKSSSSRARRRLARKQSGEQQKKSSSLVERRGIFWLASYPKSGNTWMRYMLECYWGHNPTINSMQYIEDDIRRFDTQGVSCRTIDNMTDEEMLLCRPAMLLDKLTRWKFKTIPMVLKTHHRMSIAPDYITPQWLTSGIIYIFRDPRDIVISLASHTDFTIDESIDMLNHPEAAIENKGHSLKHFLGDWSMHVESYLKQSYMPNTIGIKYEQMLENPKGSLITALRFLRTKLEFDHIETVIEQSTFDKLKEQEKKDPFIEVGKKKFFNHGTAGHWKDILSKAQVKKIVDKHGKLMEDVGYEL